MDKYYEGDFDNLKYTREQLDNVKGDILSLICQMRSKIEEIDRIQCGLDNKHEFELDRFERLIYPGAEPPGVYFFKCIKCGEIVAVKATQMDRISFSMVQRNNN